MKQPTSHSALCWSPGSCSHLPCQSKVLWVHPLGLPCPVPAGQLSCPSQQSVEQSCARTWNQRRLASSEPRIWYLDCNADLLSYMLSSCLFDNCSGREALPTQCNLKLTPPIDAQGTWLQTNPVLPGFQASDMKAGHEDTARALIIRLGLWSLLVYLEYGALRSCLAFCMRIIRMTHRVRACNRPPQFR